MPGGAIVVFRQYTVKENVILQFCEGIQLFLNILRQFLHIIALSIYMVHIRKDRVFFPHVIKHVIKR